jgi:dihydroneopterin aldolase
MDYIFIEAWRTEAKVGIYSRERFAAQTVELDLRFGLPEKASAHDSIAETIDYAKVIERVNVELAGKHFNLIETLAEFVADLVCSEFAAPWVKVRVAKLGVAKGVRRAGVCLERENPAKADGGTTPEEGMTQ